MNITGRPQSRSVPLKGFGIGYVNRCVFIKKELYHYRITEKNKYSAVHIAKCFVFPPILLPYHPIAVHKGCIHSKVTNIIYNVHVEICEECPS